MKKRLKQNPFTYLDYYNQGLFYLEIVPFFQAMYKIVGNTARLIRGPFDLRPNPAAAPFTEGLFDWDSYDWRIKGWRDHGLLRCDIDEVELYLPKRPLRITGDTWLPSAGRDAPIREILNPKDWEVEDDEE